MTSYRESEVTEDLGGREGYRKFRLSDGSRAYSLTQLTGPVEVGDKVVINTTAVELGLGSGGWHVVHWNLTRGPWSQAGPGHLMKMRYTSLQADTGAAEEDGEVNNDLEGMPVIVGGVHSQVPAIAAMIDAQRPGTRVAYVMTDGAALPLAMSDMIASLLEKDLIHSTVTTGHAFGGDLEALNVPSALTLARHRLGAEICVVAMGPGIAGTGTRLGFTGLEVAPALDGAAWLNGRPVACLRCSNGDQRDRHRGISHHSLTVLDAVRSEVDVALAPTVEPHGSRHRWHRVEPGDVGQVLASHGIRVTTMGRTTSEDPLFFASAGAAGVLGAQMVDGAV
ncbi:MAG: DUF3866 family protein [Acidimicrobiales bacterium]|nr:DUF3866 family protein [Acidimicrobiales bacterium]